MKNTRNPSSRNTIVARLQDSLERKNSLIVESQDALKECIYIFESFITELQEINRLTEKSLKDTKGQM
jgi:hypothetical protein